MIYPISKEHVYQAVQCHDEHHFSTLTHDITS